MGTKHPLRRWRVARGLRQKDVAASIGCTQVTISRVEGGLRTAHGIIEKLVTLGSGALKSDDFKPRRRKRRLANGSKSKAKGRNKARRGQKR